MPVQRAGLPLELARGKGSPVIEIGEEQERVGGSSVELSRCVAGV